MTAIPPRARIVDRLPRFSERIAALAVCFVAASAVAQILLAPDTTSRDIDAFIRAKMQLPVRNLDDRWSIVAAGDIMLSRYVDTLMERNGSVDYPFDAVRWYVRSGDLSIANLEHPVASGAKVSVTGMRFRADIDTLPAIADAGFDVVTLANNHMFDAGTGALLETLTHLDEAGLLFAGAGNDDAEARSPVLLTVRGTRVAVLAYGDPRFEGQIRFADDKPGIAKASVAAMRQDILEARRHADVVIVSLHAGWEYRSAPDPLQRTIAREIREAGADIVLGHHPHVIQPLEQSGGGWIIFSLGNLVFDQMWSEDTRRGMLLKFLFDRSNVYGIEAVPVLIFDYAQPQIAMSPGKDKSLRRLDHPVRPATVIRWGTRFAPLVLTRAMALQPEPSPGVRRIKTIEEQIDGIPVTFRLRDGRIVASARSGLPSTGTPREWWVEDIAAADTDGDGRRELIALTWAEENGNVRQRIRALTFAQGSFGELWQSKPLDAPACELGLADMNADNKEDLVLLEATHATAASCSADHIAFRGLQEDLAPLWRSKRGQYWDLRTEPIKDGTQIVVNGSAGAS